MSKREHKQPLQIYMLLPRKNCQDCGQPTCLAFAVALIRREAVPAECPELLNDEYKVQFNTLEELFAPTGTVEKSGLLIESGKCTGCGDCVVACANSKRGKGPGISTDASRAERTGDILQVVNGVITVVNWQACVRTLKPPEYCRVCEARCPFGALELVK